MHWYTLFLRKELKDGVSKVVECGQYVIYCRSMLKRSRLQIIIEKQRRFHMLINIMLVIIGKIHLVNILSADSLSYHPAELSLIFVNKHYAFVSAVQKCTCML